MKIKKTVCIGNKKINYFDYDIKTRITRNEK